MKQNEKNRREEIINTAVELFYEYGYQKASLRDIAKKVGVTQAAIYYHFKSKEELLFIIIEKFSNELLFNLKTFLSRKNDPVKNLRDAIFYHATSIMPNRNGTKIIIEDKRFLSDALKKSVQEKERIIFLLYKNYLKDLQDLKLVKECDLSVATFSLLGTINWLYHWFNPKKNLSIEKVAESMIDNLFFGIMNT